MDEIQELAQKIAKFPLFHELENRPEDLIQLARLMKLESFQSRAFIIDERQSDSRMFFLLDGQVMVSKMNEKGEIIVIGKTDARSYPFFGESVLLGNFRKSANVVAQTQCLCFSLEAKDFAAFMETHSPIVASIYRNLAKVLFDRLMKANRDILIAGLELKK
jgi:CRP-like cAMP-binding protein